MRITYGNKITAKKIRKGNKVFIAHSRGSECQFVDLHFARDHSYSPPGLLTLTPSNRRGVDHDELKAKINDRYSRSKFKRDMNIVTKSDGKVTIHS